MVFDALGNEPGHMSVGNLRRIAFRLTGDGLNAQLIDLSGGLRGQYGAEAQFLEEHCPEWEVLIEI